MAVYTTLTESDITALLSRYDLGTLTAFTGIESGVENTNYFIDMLCLGQTSQRYVLTLFEYLPAHTVPFFLDLTQMLDRAGLPTPAPLYDRHGIALHELKGKPCVVQRFLSGSPQITRSLDHCAAVGDMLARMHCAGKNSDLSQPNQRGMLWLEQEITRMRPLMPSSQAQLLDQHWQGIRHTVSRVADDLPCGLIHGDLFYDNVLFTGNEISGVIDFYNACTDWLAYDVAVTVNDWCQDHNTHRLDGQKMHYLLQAYQKVRPLSEVERRTWPDLLKLAALRFWVSRLYTFVYTPDDNNPALITAKNPDDFQNLLVHIDADSAQFAL